MNETEKRRKRLLEQTRKQYGDSRVTPAVHPRYSGVYASLYKSEETERSDGFGIRLFIAILLFAAFVAMDYSKEKVGTVSSGQIVEEITKDSFR